MKHLTVCVIAIISICGCDTEKAIGDKKHPRNSTDGTDHIYAGIGTKYYNIPTAFLLGRAASFSTEYEDSINVSISLGFCFSSEADLLQSYLSCEPTRQIGVVLTQSCNPLDSFGFDEDCRADRRISIIFDALYPALDQDSSEVSHELHTYARTLFDDQKTSSVDIVRYIPSQQTTPRAIYFVGRSTQADDTHLHCTISPYYPTNTCRLYTILNDYAILQIQIPDELIPHWRAVQKEVNSRLSVYKDGNLAIKRGNDA